MKILVSNCLLLLLVVGGLLLASAQQPQVTEPNPQALQGINSKWTNGVAPGYYPRCSPTSCSSTLTLSVGAGTCFDTTGARQTYAGGTLTMTGSTTNYVYLATSNCALTQNTTGYPATGAIPIASVTTTTTITAITDDRTPFRGVAAASGGCSTGTNNPGTCLLEEHTVTGVSSSELDFTSCISNSSYDMFRVEWTFNTNSFIGNPYIAMRFSTNGGSSYDNSAIYDTGGVVYTPAGTAAAASDATNGTFIALTDNVSSSSGNISGYFIIYFPANSTANKVVIGQSGYLNVSSSVYQGRSAIGAYKNTATVNAFNMFYTVGVLQTNSTARCYGMTK